MEIEKQFSTPKLQKAEVARSDNGTTFQRDRCVACMQARLPDGKI